MRFRITIVHCRIIAVGLLLAGCLLDAGALSLGNTGDFFPPGCGEMCNQGLQVGSAALPTSLQFDRSPSERSLLARLLADGLSALSQGVAASDDSRLQRLDRWQVAPLHPLCDQARHERTGVFLS